MSNVEPKIVGLWKLISWQLIGKDGAALSPFGENAQGFLFYHPGGFMSVHLMTANRPAFVAENVFGATPQEALTAFNSYASYCGRYSIKGDVVSHHIELVSVPNWIGTTQARRFEVDDNQLILTHKLEKDGENKDSKLIWQRVMV